MSASQTATRHVHKAWFCERCGGPLAWAEVEGKEHQTCGHCGWVVYIDPKVAAGVILALNGEIVLLKRGIPPSVGKWVFPGGYVDAGEPTERAAAREALEEVGLEVETEELIGVYSYEGNRVILVVYSGHAVGGTLEGNFEALDVRSFPLDEIPWDDLAFPSTRSAIEDWLKRIETETVS
ncbi:MAG: NUDIX hydrolase [Gemmatimonadetes bacterium]|nr:NUDIX hydrolase [Gemmatimonadota bacterium]